MVRVIANNDGEWEVRQVEMDLWEVYSPSGVLVGEVVPMGEDGEWAYAQTGNEFDMVSGTIEDACNALIDEYSGNNNGKGWLSWLK